MRQIKTTNATLRRVSNGLLPGSATACAWCPSRRATRKLMIAALAVATVLLTAYVDPAASGRALDELSGAAGRLPFLIGLGIERVSVTGHRMTRDAEIFEALDLGGARLLPNIGGSAARARVEHLPWIATARVERVFPNAVHVHVTEHPAFAVWRRGGGEQLIDSTGRVLASIQPGSMGGLPVVAGEGAATEASALLSLLSREPQLARRFKLAERVAGRRWTLYVRNGPVVLLPAGREAAALDVFCRRGDAGLMLSQENLLIDLRVQGRVGIRLVEPQSPEKNSS